MATTSKSWSFLTGEPCMDALISLGRGNFAQGIWNAYRFARNNAPFYNMGVTPVNVTTTGGSATDTVTLTVHTPMIINKVDFETTDLDTVSIQLKVNGREIMPHSMTGSDVTDDVDSRLLDAFQDVPVLAALGEKDVLEILLTDSGGGQAIDIAIVGILLPIEEA